MAAAASWLRHNNEQDDGLRSPETDDKLFLLQEGARVFTMESEQSDWRRVISSWSPLLLDGMRGNGDFH